MSTVAEQLDSIKRAHRALYDCFVWKSDNEEVGRPEDWSRPHRRGDKLYGDCDSFAMEMDSRSANLVSIKMRKFAICRIDPKSRQQDHCVLAFIDNDDIWISDCNSSMLKLRQDLPYDLWAWNKDAINGPWETF